MHSQPWPARMLAPISLRPGLCKRNSEEVFNFVVGDEGGPQYLVGFFMKIYVG